MAENKTACEVISGKMRSRFMEKIGPWQFETVKGLSLFRELNQSNNGWELSEWSINNDIHHEIF